MSRNDSIDFVDEGTFRARLRKLYRLTISEGFRNGVDLNEYEFINCEGFNDIIDVYYTNNVNDFNLSVRGSERNGYRILSSILDEALNEEA